MHKIGFGYLGALDAGNVTRGNIGNLIDRSNTTLPGKKIVPARACAILAQPEIELHVNAVMVGIEGLRPVSKFAELREDLRREMRQIRTCGHMSPQCQG